MFRPTSITPAHRDHLRRLKTEFDEACAAVPDFADQGSAAFQTARELYRTWIKAIDAVALALLDDLDARDGATPEATGPRRPASPVEAVRPGDVEHVFAEIDEGLHARAMVDASDEDEVDILGVGTG
jgi:hypothetical protein